MEFNKATSVPGLKFKFSNAYLFKELFLGSTTINLEPFFAAFLKKVAATGWFSVGLAPITIITSEFSES